MISNWRPSWFRHLGFLDFLKSSESHQNRHKSNLNKKENTKAIYLTIKCKFDFCAFKTGIYRFQKNPPVKKLVAMVAFSESCMNYHTKLFPDKFLRNFAPNIRKVLNVQSRHEQTPSTPPSGPDRWNLHCVVFHSEEWTNSPQEPILSLFCLLLTQNYSMSKSEFIIWTILETFVELAFLKFLARTDIPEVTDKSIQYYKPCAKCTLIKWLKTATRLKTMRSFRRSAVSI